jgi:Ca2+-dependent lipid-binding protein
VHRYAAAFLMQVEKTNVIKNTLNPVWNERKWLLVQV